MGLNMHFRKNTSGDTVTTEVDMSLVSSVVWMTLSCKKQVL